MSALANQSSGNGDGGGDGSDDVVDIIAAVNVDIPPHEWPPAALCGIDGVGVSLEGLARRVSEGPAAFEGLRATASFASGSPWGAAIPAAEVDAVHAACHMATTKLVQDLHCHNEAMASFEVSRAELAAKLATAKSEVEKLVAEATSARGGDAKTLKRHAEEAKQLREELRSTTTRLADAETELAKVSHFRVLRGYARAHMPSPAQVRTHHGWTHAVCPTRVCM